MAAGETVDPRTGRRTRPLLVLVAVVTLGAGVRCWQIGESLWLDELHTAWVVAGNVDELAQRAQLGNQSPLYFYLVKLITTLAGMSEWTLRLPSLVAGLALLVLSYLLTISWTRSPVAAVCAACLLAVDHHAIFYSQEARPYAFVQLLGTLHVYLFWRLQQHPTGLLRTVTVLLAALLFWLHYTSSLLLLAEYTWYALFSVRVGTAYRPRMLLVDMGVLALCLTPALPHLANILAVRENWAMFVRRRHPTAAVRWFSLHTYVLLPALLTAATLLVNRARQGGAASRLLKLGLLSLVICWFVVPVGVAWSLTWWDITRLFFARYLLASGIAPIFFAAMMVATVRSCWQQRAVATLVTITAIWSAGLIQQLREDGRLLADRNQDWRGAVSWIQPHVRNLPVLFRSGLIEADNLSANSPLALRRYCLLPVTGLYEIEARSEQLVPLRTTSAGQLDSNVVQRVRSAGGCCCLINGRSTSQRKTVEEIQAAFHKHGLEARTAQQQRFGDVLALRLKLTSAESK